MNTVTRFFDFLRTLLGLEQDVDAIVKSTAKVVRKLDQRATAQTKRATAEEERAAALAADAASRRANAERAERVKAKFAEMLVD